MFEKVLHTLHNVPNQNYEHKILNLVSIYNIYLS